MRKRYQIWPQAQAPTGSRRAEEQTERRREYGSRRGRAEKEERGSEADSLVINKNQISGRIAQSQTATRFAYAVAFCALCTLRRMCSVCGEGGKGAWQPSSSSIRSPACIKQRRLGSCFVGTTCFGPNSRYLHRLEAPPLPLLLPSPGCCCGSHCVPPIASLQLLFFAYFIVLALVEWKLKIAVSFLQSLSVSASRSLGESPDLCVCFRSGLFFVF